MIRPPRRRHSRSRWGWQSPPPNRSI
jgi:hypothetical protein